jgi:Zn-dependent alcohol dehydrogenase
MQITAALVLAPGANFTLEDVVKTCPFEQINDAIAAQHHGDCVKVVLTMAGHPASIADEV